MGAEVRLRTPTPDDVAELAHLRADPQVFQWWRGGGDLVAAVISDMNEPNSIAYVIEVDDQIVGWIQWSQDIAPDYRCAQIDIWIAADLHGRGIGTDALRTLVRHIFDEHGHHRIEIDPATENAAAIRCYTKVGFKPVGIQRRHERGNDGSWHDSLLMDLLSDEFDSAGF